MIQRLVPAFAALCALLASPRAWADGSSELEGLLEQKIVTAASKSAETDESAPATATTITAEDLQRHGIRTVAAAVRFLVPGAIVEEIPNASIGSRGLLVPFDEGSHVLVLVDGHSIDNELDGSVDLESGVGVPIELIDHIEVVLGPGSVLYGSNAMFGVVNVVTKQARNHHGLKLGADAEVGRAYRGSLSGGAEFELFGEHGEVTFGIEHSRLNAPLELGTQNAGNDAYTGMPLKTRADGSQNGLYGGTWTHNLLNVSSGYSRLTLGDFQLAARVGQHGGNDPSFLFDFDNPDTGYRRRWLSLDLQYTKRLSERTDVKLRLYGDETRRDFYWRSSAPLYCLPGELAGCQTNTHGGAEWLGLEAQAHIDWFATARHVTLFGVDGRVRNIQFASDNVDSNTGRDTGSAAYYSKIDQVLGAYVEHIAHLSSTVSVNLGTRLDAYPAMKSALSPRAAVVLKPWRDGTLKAIYSSAFQAPLPSNLAFAQPLFIVPAIRLGHERVNSFELAAEQRFLQHALRTSLFYSRWQDMVALVRLNEAELISAKRAGLLLPFVQDAWQYRNAYDIESYGFTTVIEGSFASRRLRYGLSLTESFARTRQGPGDLMRLQGAPATQGSLRLSYDFGEPWPTLGLTATASGSVLVYGLNQATFPNAPALAPRLLTLMNASGPVPGLTQLRYRLGLQLASGGSSASPVGLIKNRTPENPEPLLFPLRTFSLFGGLSYSFE